MDEEQYTNQPENTENKLLSVLSDKKKLLIIGGVALGIVIVIWGILILVSNPTKKNTNKLTEVNKKNVIDKTIPEQSNSRLTAPSEVPPTIPEQLSPENVAKEFYDWYVSNPHALDSLSYKTRNDITVEYKEIMGGYVARGLDPQHDPIFNCGDIVMPKTIKTKSAVYDRQHSQALVTIYNPFNERDLYQIKLQNVKGLWLIKDVWCAP